MRTPVYQAIVTTYRGPTDHRGARVIARCEGGKLTMPWDYSLDPAPNHRLAAEALARKLDWNDPLVQGALPGDGGYCFVLVGRK